MNLCNDGHEEIVYEDGRCPLCATIQETDNTISDLNDEIHDLNEEIDKLTEQLRDSGQ